MNVLSSGRPLGYGDYKDCCRPLRRLLKQYGSGSLEAGLKFAKANGNALSELVALLNVDRPVRMTDRASDRRSRSHCGGACQSHRPPPAGILRVGPAEA